MHASDQQRRARDSAQHVQDSLALHSAESSKHVFDLGTALGAAVLGGVLGFFGALAVQVRTEQRTKREAAKLLTAAARTPCETLWQKLQALPDSTAPAYSVSSVKDYFSRHDALVPQGNADELHVLWRTASALPQKTLDLWSVAFERLDAANKTYQDMRALIPLPSAAISVQLVDEYRTIVGTALKSICSALDSMNAFAAAETRVAIAQLVRER
jgi:hypothetical protein